MSYSDTIAAPATPPGKGGIGIVRVSGQRVKALAEKLLGRTPSPRLAEYHAFRDVDHSTIDMGLVLYFPAPHSFTGEDVIEFHGHGGPVVIERLLQRILRFNIRLAKPGEFSERAFLNDKIDLAQAEAIADLIDSASEQAARSAIRSLQGEFSRQINVLLEQLIHLRMYVEAAIDFPEEEIDFLSDGKVANDLREMINAVEHVRGAAKQGAILQQGMTVVIAGQPNAGKSTLLNALSGRDSAIVTDVPGTTRDVLREQIVLDGLPLHIVDTAGIRDSCDPVEQEGIRRAWQAIEQADRLLLIIDSQECDDYAAMASLITQQMPAKLPTTIILNKTDIVDVDNEKIKQFDCPVICLSAKTGQGVDELRDHLKTCVGYDSTAESGFLARHRHLDALNRAYSFIQAGREQLELAKAGELLAEELRQAQLSLSEITGAFTSDDLLGNIFSSFCIGK